MEPEESNKKTQEGAENTSSISSDLIRGHINTIILRMLYDGDKYGYEIIDEIEEKSKGQYTLKQPTLYSALKRLESQDYVTSYWGGASNGGRRKYFQITEKGKAVVEQNCAEWEYSRTVIDSLISERDYDFSNPPPASSVDFQILKKSTSRVPVSYAEEEDDIELMDVSPSSRQQEEDEEETVQEIAEDKQQTQAAEEQTHTEEKEERVESAAAQSTQSTSVTETAEAENTYAEERETREEQTKTPDPIPLTEADKQRIHENYRALIGNEEDATSHYYAHVSKDKAEQPAPQPPYEQQQYAQQPYGQQQYAQQDFEQSEYDYRAYAEQENGYANGPSAADMMYSSKSPAERNYKDLLNKLYDSSNSRESYYEEMEMQAMQPQPEPEPPVPEQAPAPQPQPVYEQPAPVQEAPAQPVRPRGNTASNIEFYDVEEQAQRDGLRVTTTNGSKNRTMSRTVGNTFNKGKALFITAVYVFILMLAECIANHLLKDKLQTNIFYIVIPYVITFLMLGVFLFLYLNGYGKNCRKSQSRTYISASFIIFVDVVLVIALVAYLVIFFGDATLPTWVQIVKYAVIPVIFTFNLPLFAIIYRANCNKQ